MANKKCVCPCDFQSLLSKCADRVVYNMHNFPLEDIACLPPDVKDLLLNRITYSETLLHEIDFPRVFPILLHKNTQIVNLRKVKDQDLNKVNDKTLEAISICEYLKHLSFPIGPTFTTEALVKLFKNLKKLRWLFLPICHGFTDEVVQVIADNCPLLEHINVYGSSVTDRGITALSKLTNLQYVSFSRTEVGHEGITALVEGKSGRNIVELKIDNCINVTDATLRKVIECCPKLEILLFYNCDPSTSRYEMMSTLQEDRLKNLKQLTWTVTW